MDNFRAIRASAVAGEVLSGVTRHYIQLLLAAWPAVLFIALAYAFTGWVYHNSGYFDFVSAGMDNIDTDALAEIEQRMNAGPSGFVLQVLPIVNIIAAAIAAVRWHRFVLLGEGASGSAGRVQPFRREDRKYLWNLFKVSLVGMLALLVTIGVLSGLYFILLKLGGNSAATLVVFLVTLVGYFWAMGLFLRLSLALPDAAVGGEGKVFDLFRRSAGNTWPLTGALFLIALALLAGAIVWGLISYMIFSAGLSLVGIAIIMVSYVVLYFFFLMTQVTLLSVAYREIIGLPVSDGPVGYSAV